MKRAMGIGAAIVLTLPIPSTLLGWGPEIVASLAQTRLTENAKRGESLTDRRYEPRICRKTGNVARGAAAPGPDMIKGLPAWVSLSLI